MNTKLLSAVAISTLLAFGSSAFAATSSASSSANGTFSTELDGNTVIAVHQTAQTQLIIGSNNHAAQGAGTIYAGVHARGNVTIAVDQTAQTQLIIGSNNTATQQAGSIGAPTL